jgi:hypothetical protein
MPNQSNSIIAPAPEARELLERAILGMRSQGILQVCSVRRLLWWTVALPASSLALALLVGADSCLLA